MLKRHPGLQDLSRDHHDVLVQCQKIRKAALRHAPKAEWTSMAEAILAFFDSDLEPHFQEEEELVLPLASRSTPLAVLVSHVRLDHDALRADMSELRSALGRRADCQEFLRRIEARLSKHVRYEEEELFEALQRTNSDENLDALWRRSHAFRSQHRSPAACGMHPGPSA